MANNAALAAALLVLFLAGPSTADDKLPDKVSPNPAPLPPPKAVDKGQVENGTSSGTTNGRDGETNGAAVPPPPSGTTNGRDGETNGRDGEKDEGQVCDAATEKCRVGDLVACLQQSGDVSKELFLVIQNAGNDALTVNILTSLNIKSKKQSVAKHNAEKISLSTDATNVTDAIKIILNAGKGDCILQIAPSVSDWKRPQQFLAYANRLSPIHGAYFLVIIIVIVGGALAICKYRRKSRRADSGIPYQQLEMGTQLQSSSAIADTSTTTGWDESWGDDWDEEEAVGRPSDKRSTENVSSNGLSSRPPSKDGWDVDWDDEKF